MAGWVFSTGSAILWSSGACQIPAQLDEMIGECAPHHAPQRREGGGLDTPLHSMRPKTPEEGELGRAMHQFQRDREGVTMSICKVEKIEALRGYRYMVTTADGMIYTTPPTTSVARHESLPAAGVRGAIAAMSGPFWAAIEVDVEGYLLTLEGVEF